MILNRRNFLITGVGLLAPISTPPTSLASAEKAYRNQGKKYFVAVNGSDSGPGTEGQPWATVNCAAHRVEAGDTVVVRGGQYILTAQVRLRNSGRSDAWITFIGYPGEEPILDARLVPHSSLAPNGLDNGAFQIEGVSYVRIAKLSIINSHDAGFTVRNAKNIDIINNSTKGTFSSGIAVWNTDRDDKKTQHIRILGNSITRATTWDLEPDDILSRDEAPHEAVSIGGAVDFEIAYNHVYYSDKEGIDIKETSKRGKVHHNYVHHVSRQGVYVDAWFGKINDIEIYSNVICNNGAGLIISVENGTSVETVKIHDNLIFNNKGSGLYFSRFGVDGERRDIQIANNTFYHNGYGPPADGQSYYWMPGGLYLYSNKVHDISIRNNIFSDNCGFQIGFSELLLKSKQSWETVSREQAIRISGNLIHGTNTIGSPITSGGDPSDRVQIYAVSGDQAVFGDPLFKSAERQDFTPTRGSPASIGGVKAGVFVPKQGSTQWWQRNFPPPLIFDVN